jgi:hypothetical protein
MLENQLSAPTLKGVIDFGFADLLRCAESVLRSLQGKGLTKNRSEAELDIAKINKSLCMIHNTQIIF